MYEMVRNRMKFGDVISFSGKGDISNLIKWETNSDISHVGIVLDTELIQGKKRIVLVESTSLVNLPDLRTKEIWKGVQIHHLSQRLDNYNGQAYYHELQADLSEDCINNMKDWLFDVHGSKTPYDSAQALGSAIDIFDNLGLANKPDFSSLFCSEMVAKVFNIAGLTKVNPSEQTPADVVKYNFLSERIQIK